jgi:hypothetical protein
MTDKNNIISITDDINLNNIKIKSLSLDRDTSNNSNNWP